MKQQFLIGSVLSVCMAMVAQASELDLDFEFYGLYGAYSGTIEANYDATGNNHSTNFSPGEGRQTADGVPYPPTSPFTVTWSQEKKLYADSGSVELGGVKVEFNGGTAATNPVGTAGGATMGIGFGGEIGSDATDGNLKNNEVQVIWFSQFTNSTANDIQTDAIFQLTIPATSSAQGGSSEYTSSDGTVTNSQGWTYGFQVEWFDVNDINNNVVLTVGVPYSAEEQTITIVDEDVVFESGVTYMMDMIWNFQVPDVELKQNEKTSVSWAPQVSFSMPIPIPEPGTLALLGLGATALIARRRRSHSL